MPRPPAPKAKTTKTAGPPMGLIGVVTALLVAVVAVLVYLAVRGDGLDAQGSSDALPEGGGLAVNPEVSEVPEVHVYADFQCPYCGQLEQTSGEAFADAAAAGDIKLTYTFMSFLDDSLNNDASARAANAAVCSADTSRLTSFVQEAFARQPATEGEGYPDQAFLDAAGEAGIEGEALDTFTSCVQDQTYAGYVQDMAERSTADGVTRSPVVTIDGEEISQQQMSALLSDPSALDTILADSR